MTKKDYVRMYEMLARIYVEEGAALKPSTCASLLSLLAQIHAKTRGGAA